MAKAKKSIPFNFVLENLYSLDPMVRPMFGSHAVYVENKIVLVLRDKDDYDSGVWIATSKEHHESLKKEFPKMHSITIWGPGVSGWQVLSQEDDGFEESVNRACELILKKDPRIGKVPKPRKKKVRSP